MRLPDDSTMADNNSAFRTPHAALFPALARLDVMLHRQVLRLRASHQLVENEYRGLYIPDEQVDALLRQHNLAGTPTTAVLTTQIDQLRANEDGQLFAQLRRWFSLNDDEIDLLLIALAPEVDLRYETLYAYVQNDVAKKRPTVDLAFKLLYPDPQSRLENAAVLSPDGPLLRHHLLRLRPDAQDSAPSRLAHYLQVDERITAFLLGRSEIDERLRPFTTRYAQSPTANLPASLRAQLDRTAVYLNGAPGLICLAGTYGAGKQAAAAMMCAAWGQQLLVVDVRLALANGSPLSLILTLLQQEARLQNAALYLSPFALIREDARLQDAFWASLNETPCAIFLGDTVPVYPTGAWPARPFFLFELPLPDTTERERLWRAALNGSGVDGETAVTEVAHKFRLSPGQISDAARQTITLAAAAQRPITPADLHTAARARSNQALRDLAQKLEPKYHWDDIVLPRHVLRQLHDVYHAVKFRHIVYGQWGFEDKLALGKGLNVLFSGPSGAGKTMAADILAHELALDIYKIDLSTVVSKYIGETEKNLDRIFSAAQASNAILFFDEADALFGKRSEVKDARDRYANIEVAYLLQKMEEYDGITILATNLSGNMDDAFARRLHHAIEFPFPDKEMREEIWRRVFPAATPLAEDVDFLFLARQFELSGGNIRNVALAAAFMAAEKETAVTMPLLVLGVARELQKMNRLPAKTDFREYFALVREMS
ncbi:MAG: ATP-binding protein [Chloroflexi bacterium]|nr:ATP-binding protein [Chloroflexota bacterium]